MEKEAFGVGPFAPVKPVQLVVGGEPLWSYLESIIDKKVNKVSLNIFEKLVDFLCSYLYSRYNKRFEFKASQLIVFEPLVVGEQFDLPSPPVVPFEVPVVNGIAGKVFEFQDGGKLYDQTANSLVELKDCSDTHPLTKEKKILKDQLLIRGMHIIFGKFPEEVFGQSHGTKHVVVCDNKDFPELVMIYERDLKDNMKAWVVNTTVIPWVNTETLPDGSVKFLPSYVGAKLVFDKVLVK